MQNHDPKLLVVNDVASGRQGLVALLAHEGYTNVAAARDSFEAISLLQNETFDLVLLDVMSPDVTGRMILEQLKAERKLADLPVIVISEIAEFETVVTLGAETCLLRPYSAALLKARIRSSLDRKFIRDNFNARLARMETELNDARQLQLSMVPIKFPAPTKERPIEMFAVMEPARELGGDLYDFYYRDDGRLCFIIGDVSDKGAPAALFMARTKDVVRLVSTIFRFTPLQHASPAEIVGRVNHELCLDNSAAMFVTLFLGVIDMQSGELEFCNAGHNSPYLFRCAAEIMQISEAKGPPIGIRSKARYDCGRVTLELGDSLFLFTDGVTDTLNEQGDLFNETRLEELLNLHCTKSPEGMILSIMTAIREFRRSAAPADDVTMLALRRRPISS
jgi:phosphoserine phosphatase RsbU/P